MNIPKEAIEKAIEGGWKLNREVEHRDFSEEPTFGKRGIAYKTTDALIYGEKSYADIALDPTFWQALGKSLEWNKIADGKDWSPEKYGFMPVWKHYALKFYDLILTNGDTDTFWKELLATNN